MVRQYNTQTPSLCSISKFNGEWRNILMRSAHHAVDT